jgi:hypothetical protein
LVSLCACGLPAAAQDRLPAINRLGQAGLIEMPSAFMAPEGTAWAGASGGPAPGWRYGFAGFQPLPWLEIAVRYGAFSPSGEAQPDFDLFGADLKLRLLPESAGLPEIAVGARGLFGEGVSTGEYLAASKHFRWGEATVGVGWGRYAGGGLLPNPLRVLGGDFARDRPLIRESGPTGFDDLFAGEDIGLFGGLSLRTPWPDLQLQIEAGGGDAAVERRLDPAFEDGLPLNVGLLWRPIDNLQLGAAFERGERVVLRLAFGLRPGDLPLRTPPGDPPPIAPRTDGPGEADAETVEHALDAAGIRVAAVELRDKRVAVWIEADPRRPAALQIGRAARALTEAAPPRVAAFTINLGAGGFDPATVTLARGDLERAGRFAGSAEEIWRDAELGPGGRPPDAGKGIAADAWLELRGESGLRAPEADALYRVSLLAEAELRPWGGLVFGAAARAGLADNLVPPDPAEQPAVPVRSDRVLFADGPAVRLERAWVGWRWRPRADLFAETAVGYLEEAYAGIRTEALWRPFGRRFAIGFDTVQAVRRDPHSQLRLAPSHAGTAHLNLYWRPPGTGLTAQLSAGRYLAGDIGATVRAWRDFDNGLRLQARATVSSAPAGDDALTGGIELVIPLQRLLPVLPDSRARLGLEPLLRDGGRRLDWPRDLYALTDAGSFEAIAGSWGRLLD